MKPLILVLLFAVSAGAQSLPDLARQERERKAKLKSERVLTTDTAKAQLTGTPETPVKPEATKTEAPATPAKTPETTKAPTPSGTATPAPTAAQAKNDEALKKYTEDLAKLRTRVVELQDQEIAIQLQLNDLKNSFLAPVTDTNARGQAQGQFDQAQNQLAATQQDLVDTRRQIQLMEAQGPPRP